MNAFIHSIEITKILYFNLDWCLNDRSQWYVTKVF